MSAGPMTGVLSGHQQRQLMGCHAGQGQGQTRGLRVQVGSREEQPTKGEKVQAGRRRGQPIQDHKKFRLGVGGLDQAGLVTALWCWDAEPLRS